MSLASASSVSLCIKGPDGAANSRRDLLQISIIMAVFTFSESSEDALVAASLAGVVVQGTYPGKDPVGRNSRKPE